MNSSEWLRQEEAKPVAAQAHKGAPKRAQNSL
jgi:hypothetical protein